MSQAPALRSATRARPEARGGIDPRRLLALGGHALFALFVFFICFTFMRPSPYDFLAAPVMLAGIGLGLRFHKSAIAFVALLILYHLGLLTALLPYLGEPDPPLWTAQSFYLMTTCLFFLMFLSRDGERRADLTLKAYTASCVFAAVGGILSYFGESGLLYASDGRAAGVFEDPNVLGSFLIMGVLYLLRGLLMREARVPLLSIAAILLILVAIFVTFSRGSWGALVAGALLMIGFTFRSAGARIRGRIVMLAASGLIVVALGFASLMTLPVVAEMFQDRFTITKDYDEGVTGRFGNQMRSIPLLLDLPEGFGPLRFRRYFGIDPHNSFIGGFANGGWLGGFAFLGMAVLTSLVGIRLCLVASPYRSRAQVIVPALLMFFAQGFQIDIDHWRHVYLMLGVVWGLECARVQWARRMSPAPRARSHRVAPATRTGVVAAQ